MKYVDCPIKIIHGTNDRVIPMKSSIKLSKINPERTRMYPIIDGGHKNLHNYSGYHRALDEILKSKPFDDIDREKTSIAFERSRRKRVKNNG